MKAVAALSSRVRRIPLRYRLPGSFAGVALLTMLILGAILLPLLSQHYSRSEASYLAAGSALAARDLSNVDWAAVAAERTASTGEANGANTEAALETARLEALSTQLRVQVFAPSGALLVDSGPVTDIDAASLASPATKTDSGTSSADAKAGRDAGDDAAAGRDAHRLPSPLGSGLFSPSDSAAGSRSGRVSNTALTENGAVVATLRLSEGPAYGATVLRTTLIAWVVAGFAAVLLAALAGWLVSRWLTRPLLAITAASDSMARGDLGARAAVERDDEIGRLAASFNTMAGTTETTVATLRRFVADAAHELGTPLTALQADLELARDRSSEPTLQRLLTRAQRQAERIQHLSADLLRLSRLDRGILPTPLQPLDLRELVLRSAEEAASRAEQAGIVFTLELHAGALPVRGNAEALRAAIGNLVDNALKFTPRGGSVTLSAHPDGGRAVIAVEDTGIGVPDADLEGLFSRFHRGRNAAAYPGSGLGLAIVQATAELHGGGVAVTRRMGRGPSEAWDPATTGASGSCFTLSLPLSPSGPSSPISSPDPVSTSVPAPA